LPDSSARPFPGPQTLVVRAAFVPDGEQPPPEFMGAFDPLRIRATLDPATGGITCNDAGMNFDGDIRAEFYPDADRDSGEDDKGTGSSAAGGSGDGG
jgi:hypothetical protein